MSMKSCATGDPIKKAALFYLQIILKTTAQTIELDRYTFGNVQIYERDQEQRTPYIILLTFATTV